MRTATSRRRVLIVNYYWPPSGGVGVLRTLKFAKFLREFGWEPVIYTADQAHYPSRDPELAKDVPENLEVIRRRILEPHGFYAKLRGHGKGDPEKDVLYVPDETGGLTRLSVWTRANLFIPDARCLWIRPSVKFLTGYLRENPVDVILTSGPPHTNTRIGYHLRKKLGIPWLADWRDPWTQADYFLSLPLSAFARAKHLRMERECLQTADRTLIVSENWAQDLRRLGGNDVHVLTNGFDAEDFTGLSPVKDSFFTLTHLGILGPDRVPKELLRAIGRLNRERPEFRRLFRLQLVGQVTSTFRRIATECGIEEEQLLLPGQLPRRQALSLAAGSSVNLLLLNQRDNAAGRIPFKLFEYLALGRPIFGFGPTISDVDDILTQTGNDGLVEYGDETATRSTLKALFWAFERGDEMQLPVKREIEKYSFREITRGLADHLTEVAG